MGSMVRQVALLTDLPGKFITGSYIQVLRHRRGLSTLTSKSRHLALVQHAAEHTVNVHPTAGMREPTIGNRWSLLVFPSLTHKLCLAICIRRLLEVLEYLVK